MSDPQFVSADPNYNGPTGPHPEARMSARAAGPMALPGDADAVTLADLREDPLGAMQRIGAAVKRDVSDPKMWLSLAASYFGPKMFNIAAPVVARAAASVGRGVQAIEPSDIVGMIPRPRQVDAAIATAQKVGAAMRTPATPAPPTTGAPPVAAPVETPSDAGAPPAPAATATPAATPALPPELGKMLKAMIDEGLSPAEANQAYVWLKQGVQPNVAYQRILDARAFVAKVPGTATDADVHGVIVHRRPRGPQ